MNKTAKPFIPVCQMYGTKTSYGKATRVGLNDLLTSAAACGKSIKQGGVGFKYWMVDDSEIDTKNDDKSVWLSKWNGFFNIDIDLKTLLAGIGVVKIIEQKRSYYSKRAGANIDYVSTKIDIVKPDEYQRIMGIIADILNTCLGVYYVYGFVTGSNAGFNYVCDARPYEMEDYNWRTEKYYNASYFYIMGTLIEYVTQFAEKCPDEEKRSIAALMLQHAEKVFDLTSVQISRVKFCGTGFEHWCGLSQLLGIAPADVIIEKGEKYAELYDTVKPAVNAYHIKEGRVTRVVDDNNDIKWDDWETRMHFGYYLAYLYKNDKAVGLEFIKSIKSEKLDAKKDRRPQIISAFMSGYGAVPDNIGRRVYDLLVREEQKTVNDDNVVLIDKYLSEKAAAIKSELEQHKKIEVVAPTGYGKTYMVGEIGRLYGNSKHIYFLTPTNSIANSAHEDMTPDDIFSSVTADVQWKRVQPGEKYRTPLPGCNFVCVFDTAKLNWLNKLDPENDIVIVDEAHSLPKTTYRADCMFGMVEFIKSWKGRLLLLSATPSFERELVEKIIVAKKKQPPVRKMTCVLYNISSKDKTPSGYILNRMREIMKTTPENEQCVIYYNFMNSKTARSLGDSLDISDYCVYSKKTPDVEKEVRKTGWYGDTRFMFVSAYGEYGINLYPQKKTHIHIFADGGSAAIQAASRVRDYSQIADITVYKRIEENTFSDRPIDEYYNGTKRDAVELDNAYRLLKKYGFGSVTYNGRAVDGRSDINGYCDYAMAVENKDKEICMLDSYARMNDIEMHVEELGTQNAKTRTGNEKIFKQYYMEQIDENMEKELLTLHVPRRVNCLKNIYKNYVKAGAPGYAFKKMFDELPDECAYEEVSKVCKAILIAGKATPAALLAHCISHVDKEDLTVDYLGALVWVWINNWPDVVVTDGRIRTEIMAAIGKVVDFAVKKQKIVRQAYDIYVLEEERGAVAQLKMGASVKSWDDKITEMCGGRQDDEKAMRLLYWLTDVNVQTEEVNVRHLDFITKKGRNGTIQETALRLCGGDKTAATKIVDKLNDEVELIVAKALRDEDEIKRIRAAAGAKGAAAGAKGAAGGAKGVEKTSKKVVVLCDFNCGGNKYHKGDAWANKAAACAELFGAKTGAARTKLDKLIANGMVHVQKAKTEKCTKTAKNDNVTD